MTLVDVWGTRLFLALAFLCLPICLFYPVTPNVTFGALLLLSFIFLLSQGRYSHILPPLKSIPFALLFTTWALVTCLWSPTPGSSLSSVGKIVITLIGANAFYVVQTEDLHKRFMRWFTAGFIIATALLLLDEVLNTYILRTLRGAHRDTPEYYHGITLLVLGIWPILNAYKHQHLSRRMLLTVAVIVGVFYMTDHAAKLAIIIGLVACLFTVTASKFFIRTAAVLSAVVILAFPFALKHMDPVEVIQNNKSLLMKPSYHHRLFILKRTTDMIFEDPWLGHGINSYRNTMIPEKKGQVADSQLRQFEEDPGQIYDIEVLGQGLHPHNLSLQIWYELGAVGAVLYALFLLASLWRISGLANRRYELSTFMGMYTSIFVIAHISFGAWQTWWLLSVGTLLSLTLWQTIKPRMKT